MSKPKFSKPPSINKDKENKLDNFLNLRDGLFNHGPSDDVLKKEKTKPVYLRAPESLWNDIHEIMARTGLSMNAICIEFLRPNVKKKLKELRNE